MKILTVMLITLSLSFLVLAGDFESLNEKNVRIFLELFPQYQALNKKYSKIAKLEDTVSISQNYLKKTKELLNRYDISPAEFAQFMQKIVIGISTVQIEKSKVSTRQFELYKLGNLSLEEINVIKKYQPKLESLFNYR